MSVTENAELHCPQCQSRLQSSVRSGSQIHVCPNEHGCWIHTKELEKGLRGTFLSRPSPSNNLKSPADPDVVMDVFFLEGIEIDVCPSTKGIWLDPHEILPVMRKNERFGVNRRDVDARRDDRGDTWFAVDAVVTVLEWISVFIW